MNFAGKTAVVTGGSRGIGRAICEELARGGANVVLCYAGRAEAAQETVTACKALGAKALAVQCNVADEAQVKALMDAAVKEFGRIDILVNNAGVTRDGLVMMMKEADFDAVIDTNLKGTFLCMKAVSRIMMKQRYGRIVNLSSVVGLRGNAGQVNYAASKAGVVGMTKSLAKELASRGVDVIGVDGSARMLEMCRRRFSPVDLANENRISLRIGELDHLPLRDQEADFACINLVLHHLSDPGEGLREIRRSLTTGGHLFVADFLQHHDETMRSRYGDRWLGFDEERLQERLRQAGFEVLSCTRQAVGRGLFLLLVRARAC